MDRLERGSEVDLNGIFVEPVAVGLYLIATGEFLNHPFQTNDKLHI